MIREIHDFCYLVLHLEPPAFITSPRRTSSLLICTHLFCLFSTLNRPRFSYFHMPLPLPQSAAYQLREFSIPLRFYEMLSRHHNDRTSTAAFNAAPCIFIGASRSCFTPLAGNVGIARTRRCSRALFKCTVEPPLSTDSQPQDESRHQRQQQPNGRFILLRRVVRVTVISFSLMISTLRGANATGQVQIPRGSASDVEAAAVTLGAVTVGGLVMRAILTSGRDEEKEREKLAAECARLEEEEILRARRLERKAMERVDEEELPEDDALRNSLSKRLKDIENNEDNSIPGILLDNDDKDKSKYLRNTPIPERGGSGSMLLDRPEDESGGDGNEGVLDNSDNTEALEKLRRMWNLDANDKDDQRKS